MHCLYLTITVSMTGVLLVTVGASPQYAFVNPGYSGNEYSGPQYQPNSVGQNRDLPWYSFVMGRQNLLRSTSTFMSGVVRIYTQKGDMICSGALLKNWIVLTVADCVHGREANDVYIKIKVNQNEDVVTFNVRVNEIKTHPDYKKQYAVKNLAILITYGKKQWDAGKFLLPENDYTTNVILHSQLEPHVYEWKAHGLFEFKPEFVKVPVTDDFRLCGVLGTIKETEWYCVDRREKYYEYKNKDRGTPIFFWKNWEPYILGLFTGFELLESMPGALYESINPSISWIKEQINLLPVPPQ